MNTRSRECESLFSDEVRLLGELGFMAALNGQVVPALRIFQALAYLRDEQAFPVIGMAVARLSVGASRSAVSVLDQALERGIEPREELLIYLALALKSAGLVEKSAAVVNKLLREDHLTDVQRSLASAIATEVSKAYRHHMFPAPARIREVANPLDAIRQ